MRPPGVPWLFKGAYANYHGETTILFVPIKSDMRFEVIDHNSTHAKVLTYLKIDTPVGSRETQNTVWIDITKEFRFNESMIIRSYEQEVYVENFGTRNCIVYEYASTPPGSLITIYVDKEVVWPVKITFTIAPTQDIPGISIDLKITDTNIPGLKK
jgi:hypothetical protein